MGGFGSRGGLRRFTPEGQGDSTDQIDISNFFCRKIVEGESQEQLFFNEEKLLKKAIQLCSTEDRDSAEKPADGD